MSSANIFDKPELFISIYPLVKARDRMALARVNRTLFYTIMPDLWTSVSGLRQLLTLIPNWYGIMKWATQPIEVFNNKIDQVDCSRFDLYAQWTKHLELCKFRMPAFKTEELYALRRLSARRPLIPHLLSLTCTDFRVHEDVQLILPFLVPSLIRLEFSIVKAWPIYDITITEASIMLHVLSKKCPYIRALAICPQPDGYKPRVAHYPLMFLSQDDQPLVIPRLRDLGSFLAAIPPLTSFSCSSELVNDSCFSIMASWICLESLEISFDSWRERALSPLPSNSFPSLRHLSLYQAEISVLNVFSRIEAITKKILSVTVFLCQDIDDGLLLHLAALSELVGQSFNLQKLWIRAKELAQNPYILEASELQVFQSLPLRCLRLEGILFQGDNDDATGSSLSIALALLEIFPDLTELITPNHPLSLVDLQYLTYRKPHLNKLSLHLMNSEVLHSIAPDINQLPRNRPASMHIVEIDLFGVNKYNWKGTGDFFTYSYADALMR
ncbi:hypothetical protein RhiJN_18316 [Ceratobasidium sp. AG-Ba]|nr:hypothetical protein RhiJN_18316 [Ceratobasidium sp. AG-Ba]